MRSDWVRATCRRTKPLAEVTKTTPTCTNTAFLLSLKKSGQLYTDPLSSKKNYTVRKVFHKLYTESQQSCHSRFTLFHVMFWALYSSARSLFWTLTNTVITEAVYTAKKISYLHCVDYNKWALVLLCCLQPVCLGNTITKWLCNIL